MILKHTSETQDIYNRANKICSYLKSYKSNESKDFLEYKDEVILITKKVIEERVLQDYVMIRIFLVSGNELTEVFAATQEEVYCLRKPNKTLGWIKHLDIVYLNEIGYGYNPDAFKPIEN